MTDTITALTEDCATCLQVRHVVDRLRLLLREPEDELRHVRLLVENDQNKMVEVRRLAVTCRVCDNRGKVLTKEGNYLLEVLREFMGPAPDPTKPREIPF